MSKEGAAGEELRLEAVSLRLGSQRLIGPLDLMVPPGEVATLMGPSGSGKSSLLAFMCGTLDPAFAAEGRILLAAAVGFSVSIALYLPTLFAGAGVRGHRLGRKRGEAAGADRRLTGVYAFLQAGLPLAGFALALALPRLVFRHLRGLLQPTGQP